MAEQGAQPSQEPLPVRSGEGEDGRSRRARAIAIPLPAALSLPGWLDLERWRAVWSPLLAAESAPGRLFPWLPVAFACGILLYFAADHEPSLWAPLALTGGAGALAIVLRARFAAWVGAVAVAGIAAGFAAATWRAQEVAHPRLTAPAWAVELTGWIEAREERERSDRILVRVDSAMAARLDTIPDRVRLSLRKGTAPAVGSYVSVTARLNPPQPPLRPGGYDFARDLYFQGIGATGFALGPIAIVVPEAEATPPGWRLAFVTRVEALRSAIDQRIRAAVPGDAGAIASALITGKRDAISEQASEAMYVSSLAHILSISGYHMALVAGVVFFVARALLALGPALALRYPIKKWAAAAALAAAAFYLVLSGAEVATRRAFIMTAIVLVGILCDRPALTLRTLAIAALVLLAMTPEALVHPSFQMSFAATLALVAALANGLPLAPAHDRGTWRHRLASWGLREFAALAIVSTVAGLATTLYAAYHFHRLAPYGVIANLAVMPIVSLWIMPAGLLALLAGPFGFDAVFWRIMGEGIDAMISLAAAVAALPGAAGRVAAFGLGPLLLGTAGLTLLCLLQTRLRLIGPGLLAAAVLWAMATPAPDVLVAADGRTVAVRRADGRLAIKRLGGDTFAARTWLAAAADSRTPADPTLAEGFRCDDVGCVAALPDGRLVAIALAADAFAEDCNRAVLVVTPRRGPPECAALLIDRAVREASGALALYRSDAFEGRGFRIEAARPPGRDRPWAPAAGPPQAIASSAARNRAVEPLLFRGGTQQPRGPPRDATPAPDALEPDD